MLKNLNDYLQIISIAIMTYYGLRIFVWAFAPNAAEEKGDKSISALLKDYINNEEE